jgi:hypothetical protein
MNSNVKGSDLAKVSEWLSVPGNLATLEGIADCLANRADFMR